MPAVPTSSRQLGSPAPKPLCRCGLTIRLVDVIRILLDDDLLYFEPQLPQQLALWISADQLALAVDRSLALTAGNAHVGHFGLSRTVHDAAHHCDFDRSGVLLGD